MVTSGMSKLPAYERDPYLTELDATVEATGEDEGGCYAVLSDTFAAVRGTQVVDALAAAETFPPEIFFR